MLRLLSKSLSLASQSGCKPYQPAAYVEFLPACNEVATLRFFRSTGGLFADSSKASDPKGSKESDDLDAANASAVPEGDANDTEGPSVEQTAKAEANELELAELKANMDGMTDRLVRTMADMENLRIRTANQISESKAFAVQGFAKQVLEVADNLERAVAAVPADMVTDDSTADRDTLHKNLKNLRTGVVLTEKVMLNVFKQSGVERIDAAEGLEFDPNLHNALFEVPTADTPAGCIVTVTKSGYTLNGRVIRAADVGVAKPVE